MKKKKNKTQYIDDGHTVYNMDGVGGAKHREDKDEPKLSKKEKRAAIRAALETYLPGLLMVMAAFTLAICLIYLWLR